MGDVHGAALILHSPLSSDLTFRKLNFAAETQELRRQTRPARLQYFDFLSKAINNDLIKLEAWLKGRKYL